MEDLLLRWLKSQLLVEQARYDVLIMKLSADTLADNWAVITELKRQIDELEFGDL